MQRVVPVCRNHSASIRLCRNGVPVRVRVSRCPLIWYSPVSDGWRLFWNLLEQHSPQGVVLEAAKLISLIDSDQPVGHVVGVSRLLSQIPCRNILLGHFDQAAKAVGLSLDLTVHLIDIGYYRAALVNGLSRVSSGQSHQSVSP